MLARLRGSGGLQHPQPVYDEAGAISKRLHICTDRPLSRRGPLSRRARRWPPGSFAAPIAPARLSPQGEKQLTLRATTGCFSSTGLFNIQFHSGLRRNETSGLGHGFIARKLTLNKLTPYLIRPPDRVQITLSLRHGDALTQHSIEKYKCRNTHVGGAMDKHGPIRERLHHSTESSEILCVRSFEIYGDMDVEHAETSNNAPLVWQSVIRCREGEIDDHRKAGLANHRKLSLCGLASSAKPVTNGAETVNLRQRGH